MQTFLKMPPPDGLLKQTNLGFGRHQDILMLLGDIVINDTHDAAQDAPDGAEQGATPMSEPLLGSRLDIHEDWKFI